MILHVINSLGVGGAERYVAELAMETKRRGAQVEVMVFDPRPTHLAATLAAHGIAIRHTLTRGHLSPLNFFTFARLMVSGRYDVIHTHLVYGQLWASVASIFNIRRVKLFTTEHSTSNHRRSRPLLRWVDRFIYSRYQRVMCISPATRQALVEWLRVTDDAKFVVVPNAVDIARFRGALAADRAEWGLSPRDVVVMMVGRMHEAKDQPTIIRAVERLPERFKCVLVGGGETILRVAGTVREPSRTILTSQRGDIPALVRMCDIYVQSSHWEGLPTTVLEAMAAQRPVLGSRVAGVSDVVPRGELFPEGDDERLAEMIAAIAADKSLAERIVAHQNRIVEGYSLPRIVDKILDLYRQ